MGVLEAGKTDGHGEVDDDCGIIMIPEVILLVSVVKITGQKMALIYRYVGIVTEFGIAAFTVVARLCF